MNGQVSYLSVQVMNNLWEIQVTEQIIEHEPYC